MGNDLISRLNKIEDKLKALKSGEVLDISNLNEEETRVISQVYSKDYFMRGPLKDEENKGKYILAFMKNYGSGKNA